MNNISMVIIPLYLIIITIIIIYIGRKVKNYKDFAVGGNNLPWIVVAGTMMATSIGGGTLIGFVGEYYANGMQWAWMAIIGFFGGWVKAKYVAGKIRSLNQDTLPDVFKIRYGKSSRIIAASLILIGEFAVVCAMMSAFGAMLSGYVGVSYDIALFIGIVLFIITAISGGFIGVAYTDAIQSIIIIAGVVIVGTLAFIKAGGFAAFAALEPNMKSIFAQNIPFSKMLGNLLSLFISSFVSQAVFVQRINACRNANDAKKAMHWYNIISAGCIILFIGSMGIGSYIMFGPGLSGNEILAKLLSEMPPIVGALYAAAIIAAILTTANSLLLSNSMNLSKDIFGEIKKDVSDKQLMFISKAYIIIATLIAYAVVKFNPSIIRWIILAYTINACLFIPMYGGLLWKKPGPAAGLISLVLSGIGTLAWELAKNPYGIHSIYIGFVLGIIGLLIGMTFNSKPTDEQMKIVDMFKQKEQIKNV